MSLGRRIIKAFRRFKRNSNVNFVISQAIQRIYANIFFGAERCAKAISNKGELKENDKHDKQEVVSKLSCGASEIISKAGESGMFVKVEVKGKVLEFLEDTGATITLVSRISSKSIVDCGSLEPLNSDVVIADGTSLNLHGVQMLPFSICGRQFQCRMVVADLTVDGILGLDFL
jgi:predicted aspartyl protease